MNKLHTVIAGIALLFGFTTTSHGQSFEFVRDSSQLSGDAGMAIKVKNSIINLTEDSIKFRWVRASSNLPSEWQKCGVCDKNLCYDDADSATFTLPPSDTGDMSINFYAYYFDDENNLHPVEGTGSLNILIYPVDSGRSHAQQAFFKASTSTTNIENPKAEKFKFYPNPAQDILKFKTDSKSSHKVTIYNTSGTRVKSMRVTGQATHELIINDLKPGTHFIHYQGPKGKHATKPFIKQ